MPHSLQFSCSGMSDSLWPHGLQHTRIPCPSPTPGVYPKSCPLSWWCHPTISSSVIPFSSRLQSFPASESFPRSQFFVSGGQSIGVSALASVLPMNIQDWFPLGWTSWISLQSKGLKSFLGNSLVVQWLVPQTTRRPNQSILEEINPEYSLEGLMLKLKLQYFGHLMWRADSLEKSWCWERLKAKGEEGGRRWNV